MATGGPASVFGCAARASASDAALINGGLMHSLEYDDTHTGSIVHGSAVLAAAAWPLARPRRNGRRSARQLCARLGGAGADRSRRAGEFQARGFQVTSVGGALVAALIGATLADLDEDQTVAALGIALSQVVRCVRVPDQRFLGQIPASGLGGACRADRRPIGPRWLDRAADRAGGRIRPVRHVRGRHRRGPQTGVLLDDFGTTWRLTEAAYKFYPCCHYIHPFIEAAGNLADRGVPPETIRRLTCRAGPGRHRSSASPGR